MTPPPAVPKGPVTGLPPVEPSLPPPTTNPKPIVPPSPPAGGTATPPAVSPVLTPPTTPPEATKPPAKIEFSKPPGGPSVTPVAGTGNEIERSPSTSFDVDIYEPKAGDSYEAISREFYNDTRFATGLRAYNRNKPLQGAGPIDVPPLHVIKRYQPGGVGATPVSRPVAGTDPGWGPAGVPTTPRGEKTFRVPQGGMSMRGVARLILGNEQRWRDVYDLNPQLRPDEILPAGTELKLPADARTP
jgi:hypothetical protein